MPDSFEIEDWLDIEDTPEKDRSGVKQDDTGVGSRPGDGEPDRDRACSCSILMIGVPGSIVIAGRQVLCSLVGVFGSRKLMNTAPMAQRSWRRLQETQIR